MSIPPRNTTNNKLKTSIIYGPEMKPLKIMTYNVNFGGVQYDGTHSYQSQRVFQAMKDNINDVDLICLQETHIG